MFYTPSIHFQSCTKSHGGLQEPSCYRAKAGRHPGQVTKIFIECTCEIVQFNQPIHPFTTPAYCLLNKLPVHCIVSLTTYDALLQPDFFFSCINNIMVPFRHIYAFWCLSADWQLAERMQTVDMPA